MKEIDAIVLLAEVMKVGSSKAILNQEADGQRDIASGTKFPSDVQGKTREEMERLGFVFGERVDEIFMSVTLPDGWKIIPTSHSMWSDIVDGSGATRGAIFYKAAFYDRVAFATLNP